MNNQDLINFNPILAKALADVECDGMEKEVLRELVAVAVKTGMPPDKIYAVIRTRRILTEQNLKFLSKADIKEWEDSCKEYSRLAGKVKRGSNL